MPQPTDIESKLAAYVDGELPPSDRVEVERYLASSPQQRKLIADLMRQRDLLRALPSEPAPLEVADAVNAQLERAVLLGDVDAEADVSAHSGRWRNLAGVAAILLLAGGLGLAIYQLLPSPNSKPPQIASIRSLPTTLSSEDAGSAFDRMATGPASRETDASEQELRVRAALVPQSQGQPQSQAAQAAAALPVAAAASTEPAEPSKAAIVLTIGTDTPQQTRDQVNALLADLALNAPSTMPTTLAAVDKATTQPSQEEAAPIVLNAVPRDVAKRLLNNILISLPDTSAGADDQIVRSLAAEAEPGAGAQAPATVQNLAENNDANAQFSGSQLQAAATQPQPIDLVLTFVQHGPATQPTTNPTSKPATEPATAPATQPNG